MYQKHQTRRAPTTRTVIPESPIKTHGPTQAAVMEQCRRESCLDSRIPLGTFAVAKPELGQSVFAYYRDKHDGGRRGAFWPLHTLVDWSGANHG